MPLRLIPLAKVGGSVALAGAIVAFFHQIPVAAPKEEFSILPSSIVGLLASLAAFFAVGDAIHRRLSDPASKVAEASAKERKDLEERIAQKQLALEERLSAKHVSLLEKMTEGFATTKTQRDDGLRRLGQVEKDLQQAKIEDAVAAERYKRLTEVLERWEELIDKWRQRDEEKYENMLTALVDLGGGKGGRHRRKGDPHDEEERR